MKLSLVKFNNAVRLDGAEVTYLDAEKHKVELEYDTKTLVVSIMSAKDFVQTTAANCIWWKPIRETKETK